MKIDLKTLPQRPRLVGLSVLLAIILAAVPSEIRGNAAGKGLGILSVIVALLAVAQEYQRWRRP
jgi:hypothetical protein